MRNYLWSVRREVWENRSIYIAPLAVMAVVLFAFFISTFSLPRRMRRAETLDPVKRHVTVVRPFAVAPSAIMLTTFLVALAYCLDAMQSERRDRSLLFWKSLPVSDRTTVLAKLSIPMIVLPLIAIVLSFITHAIIFASSTFILLVTGAGAARLWTEYHAIAEIVTMFYGITVHVLWFAPLYGWFLLLSAWVKRPFLWAVLPPVVILAMERMSNSAHFLAFIRYRFVGAMRVAFDIPPERQGIIDEFGQLTPGRFLTTPGLWLGLAFAAACVAYTIRLRRYREA